MNFRKARASECEAILNIYEGARAFMRAHGNMSQWQGGYPAREDVLADIDEGCLYVATEEEADGERLVGTFVLKEGREPVYDVIRGAWHSERPYAFMHRVAVAEHGRGVGEACLDFGYRVCRHLRIDTHRDNIPMQRLLEKCGFSLAGIVHYEKEDGDRLAFDKI